MRIQGLQKLTLLDYPGRVACTVFTRGCNMRCPFCHNASLVVPPGEMPSIPEGDFFSFLQKRKGLLDGVCISGGEPLLNPDIRDFLKKIKDLGYLVKLDTNGSYPLELKSVVKEGLVDYVAMDVKCSPECYPTASGISDLDFKPIGQSIEFLLGDGVDYEFRTTIVKEIHNSDNMKALAGLIRGAKRYFLQKFTDSGDLIGWGMTACSDDEMEDFLNIVAPFVKTAALRGV